MKQYSSLRGLALLLVCCSTLSVGCISCAPHTSDAPATEPSEQRLTVQTVPVVYSEALRQDTASRILPLLERLLFSLKGIVPDDELKATLTETVQDSYLPLLEAEGVTPEELERLLQSATTLCDRLEASETALSLSECGGFYQELIWILGTDRAGRVTYGGIRLQLETQITTWEERYDRYGYEWYRKNAEEARQQLQALTDRIGIEAFTDAMSVPAFLSSFASGALFTAEEAKTALLGDGELLQIVQRQARLFGELSVTEAQWGELGDLLAYLLTPSDGSLLQEELTLLREYGIPQQVAQTVPELLRLYASYTQAMNETHIQALRAATDEKEREQLLFSPLTGCRDAFLAYAASLSEAARTNTQAEQNACAAAGHRESLQRFLNAHPPLSAEALYEALCSQAPVDRTHALLGYLRGIAPCFTYTVYQAATQPT